MNFFNDFRQGKEDQFEENNNLNQNKSESETQLSQEINRIL